MQLTLEEAKKRFPKPLQPAPVEYARNGLHGIENARRSLPRGQLRQSARESDCRRLSGSVNAARFR
jgi:hypothetical protein